MLGQIRNAALVTILILATLISSCINVKLRNAEKEAGPLLFSYDPSCCNERYKVVKAYTVTPESDTIYYSERAIMLHMDQRMDGTCYYFKNDTTLILKFSVVNSLLNGEYTSYYLDTPGQVEYWTRYKDGNKVDSAILYDRQGLIKETVYFE